MSEQSELKHLLGFLHTKLKEGQKINQSKVEKIALLEEIVAGGGKLPKGHPALKSSAPAQCPFSGKTFGEPEEKKKGPNFVVEGVECPFMADQDDRKAFAAKVRNICIPNHPDQKDLLKQLEGYFRAADAHGKNTIERDNFDTLIEYTAEEARRHGFVPTLQQMFNGDLKKVKEHRDRTYQDMLDKNGVITLDSYKAWTLRHIRSKVENMRVKPVQSSMKDAHNFVTKLKVAQRTSNWDKALKDYKEMFQRSGDVIPGMHGEIGLTKDQWCLMIEVFAETPRILGLVPKMKDTYSGAEQMREERSKLFEKITNQGQYMTYPLFKKWIVQHLNEKMNVHCPFMADEKERRLFAAKVRNICIPDHPERHALLKQLQCYFEASDVNNDQEIQREEFDTLIEYTAEEARRNGFVPTLQTMFGGDVNKVIEFRNRTFEEMKGPEGKITLESYQEWTINHIRSKVEGMNGKTAIETNTEATAFVTKLKVAANSGDWDAALTEYRDMFNKCGAGINKEQWIIMIEVFAETPRVMGLVPKMTDTYESSEVMREERLKLFDRITDGGLCMTYEQFKGWLVDHLAEKLKAH